jgi:hypothetical protein
LDLLSLDGKDHPKDCSTSSSNPIVEGPPQPVQSWKNRQALTLFG